MDPIEVQLGESMGVLIEHSAEFSPVKLLPFLEKTFGVVSYSSTYELRNDNMATIVFFAEATVTTVCYLTLDRLVHEADRPPGLVAVAWTSEGSLETFDKRPYVARRWRATELGAVAAAGADAETGGGYITIFWRRADAGTRADLQSMAASTGQLAESFTDEKEGGRLFMRFKAESAADEYRRLIVTKYPALSRDISYGSAEEYKLAATGMRAQ